MLPMYNTLSLPLYDEHPLTHFCALLPAYKLDHQDSAVLIESPKPSFNKGCVISERLWIPTFKLLAMIVSREHHNYCLGLVI